MKTICARVGGFVVSALSHMCEFFGSKVALTVGMVEGFGIDKSGWLEDE